MAGNGSRFTAAGYKDIKPLISIFGKPMIKHVIDSVGIESNNWIFVVQKTHRDLYNIDEILSMLKPGCKIIDTGSGVTDGAACTVLLAEEYIDPEAPLFIINSDNIIQWDIKAFDKLLSEPVDGLIPVFKDTDPKWSFVELDDEGFVKQVAEKQPISDNATAGIYIWKRGEMFIDSAKRMIEKNIRVNNEFYLCPVFNESIQMGAKIITTIVKEMHGVGTPEDLKKYLEIKK